MVDGGWSDELKWGMDLVKTLLSAVLGFYITYHLLDILQLRRTEERAVCAAAVTRMHRALEEFERASPPLQPGHVRRFHRTLPMAR